MTRLEQPFVTLKKRSQKSSSKNSLAPLNMEDVVIPPGGNERFEVFFYHNSLVSLK